MFVGITLLILVVIFTLQNTAMVNIRFMTWQFSLSRALLFFMLLAVGIIIGWTTCTVNDRKKRHKQRGAQKGIPGSAAYSKDQ